MIKIEAIGNTLTVVSEDKPIRYFLFKDEAYKNLGHKPPELNISFGLQGKWTVSESAQIDIEGAFEHVVAGEFTDAQKRKITQAALGAVNKYIKEESVDKGRFMFPFFVRYAYRMYDGSLLMHSAPVLMLPSTGRAPLGIASGWHYDTQSGSNNNWRHFHFQVAAWQCALDYYALNLPSITTKLEQWGDIITGVDIFVSRPIYTYDQNGEVWGLEGIPAEGGMYAYPAFGLMRTDAGTRYGRVYPAVSQPENDFIHTPIQIKAYLRLPLVDEGVVAEQIASTSLFYKISSLSIDDISSARTLVPIEDSILNMLLYQEQMTDDYNSHNEITAGTSYSYNARLNLADIRQRIFDGFPAEAQTCFQNEQSPVAVTVYTFIRKNEKELVVESVGGNVLGSDLGYWLYYPDTAAYRMVIKRGGQYADVKLIPHAGLNGACYFGGFEALSWSTIVPTGLTLTADPSVAEPNKLYNSEVNNPFLFTPGGIVTVGTSRIIGLASSTKALSQGQFGQFPLYVFSGEGIWALEISGTGTYSSRQMMARDVCNNPRSITQLDGPIVFTSDQGVIVMQGAEMVNISKMLDGPTFCPESLSAFDEITDAAQIRGQMNALREVVPVKEFLKECVIAYDYPNNRLLLLSPEKPYAYVYSLRSNLWTMITSGYVNITNNYPDSYLTDSAGYISNLSAIISADDARVERGLIITRPLKFDAPDILKTISTVAHKGQIGDRQVVQVLYGSRNNHTFQPVASSRGGFLRRLCGTPYKVFRLVIIPTFSKRESITKTIVDLVVKYTNKVR